MNTVLITTKFARGICSEMAGSSELGWIADLMLGALPSGMTFSRASGATYFGSDGFMKTSASGTPRFDYDPATLMPRGLLMEETRTNSVTNNSATGAVPGTPGTLPTGWVVATAAGLSTQVAATGTESGMAYVDLRIVGTTTATGYSLNFTSPVAASAGQYWTASAYSKLVAGTLTNVGSVSVRLNVNNGTGSASQALATTAGGIATQRSVLTVVCGSGTTDITPRLSLSFASGVAIDFTLRVACPQMELGRCVTSVIKTTGTAATRAGEVATLGGIGTWFNPTEGTLVIDGMVSGNAVNMVYGGVSDGTSNNRIALRGLSGQLGAGVVKANVVQATLSAGTWNAGQFQRFGIAWKDSNFAVSLAGGVVQGSSSGAIPSVSQLDLGQQGSGTDYLCGWLRWVAYAPTCVSASRLRALTTN